MLWRRPDFLVSVPVGALGLALVYYSLLLRVTTLHTMGAKLANQPVYVAFLTVLVPAVLLLFGANFGMLGLMLQVRAQFRDQGGSLLGIVLGSFGAGCPSCGAFLLSLVGVSAGVSALPFAGLELWLGAGVIMGFTFWRSVRSLQTKVCVPSADGAACGTLPAVSWVYVGAIGFVGVVLAALLVWAFATNEPGGLAL
jgi:hypothetical protein